MAVIAYDLTGARLAVVPMIVAVPILLIFSFVCARFLPKTFNDRWIVAIWSALPLATALTMVDLWLQLYRCGSGASWIGVVINAAYALSVIGIILAARWSRNSNALFRALTWMLFAVVTLLPLGLLNRIREKHSGTKYADADFLDSSRPIRHVILITVDTLRRDCVHAYGERDTRTQQIDHLAENGALFMNAFSAGPWTLPSFASILTGAPPNVHRLTKFSLQLPESLPTLAERFREKGYYTAAIGDNIVLDPRTGLSRGFIEYNMYPHRGSEMGGSVGARILGWLSPERFLSEASTDQITAMAVRWLSINRHKDFFFWVHYFTPHLPYAPPRRLISSAGYIPTIGYRYMVEPSELSFREGEFAPPQEEQNWIRSLYEGAVAYADENIGRLIETLKNLQLYDDSLIVFLSDHGEEHWDHGGFEHGHTLYNELLRVPLIIKPPNSGATGKRIETHVTTQSLTPTVLELCGLPASEDYFSAGSIAPLLSPNPANFRRDPIYSAGIYRGGGQDSESIIFDDFKLIRSLKSPKEFLYDLTRDPLEKSPLPLRSEPAQKGEVLLDEAAQWSKVIRERHDWMAERKAEIPKENLQKLKALGYIR